MWDMIYALGIGVAFAVGVGLGAFLCRVATKEGRIETREEWREHNELITKLLTNKNAILERMVHEISDIKDR